MHHSFLVRSIVLLIAISCVSCGEDPKLVEKRTQQKAEIARLQSDLALMEEKLKNMPPDVAEELAQAEKKKAEQTAEVARLEGEIAELQAKKKSIQDEFDAYRSKYQVK